MSLIPNKRSIKCIIDIALDIILIIGLRMCIWRTYLVSQLTLAERKSLILMRQTGWSKQVIVEKVALVKVSQNLRDSMLTSSLVLVVCSNWSTLYVDHLLLYI